MKDRSLLQQLYQRQIGRGNSRGLPAVAMDRLTNQMLNDCPPENPSVRDNIAFVSAHSTLRHLCELFHASGGAGSPDLVEELRQLSSDLNSTVFAQFWGDTGRHNDMTTYNRYLINADLFSLLFTFLKSLHSDSDMSRWRIASQRTILRLLEWPSFWPTVETNLPRRNTVTEFLLYKLLPVPPLRPATLSLLRIVHDADQHPIHWQHYLNVDHFHEQPGTIHLYLVCLSLATEWHRSNPSANTTRLQPFVSDISLIVRLLTACRACLLAIVANECELQSLHRKRRLVKALRAIAFLISTPEAKQIRVMEQLRQSGHLGLLLNDAMAMMRLVVKNINRSKEDDALLELFIHLLSTYIETSDDPVSWYCLYTTQDLLQMLEITPIQNSKQNQSSKRPSITLHIWEALHRMFSASSVDLAFEKELAQDDDKEYHTSDSINVVSLMPTEGVIPCILRLLLSLMAQSEDEQAGNCGDLRQETESDFLRTACQFREKVQCRQTDLQWAITHGLMPAKGTSE